MVSIYILIILSSRLVETHIHLLNNTYDSLKKDEIFKNEAHHKMISESRKSLDNFMKSLEEDFGKRPIKKTKNRTNKK
jgi:hypothetical protein